MTIFERLKPAVIIRDVDGPQTMPQIGASIEVRFQEREPQTVWLSAVAWEGAAVLIRQTPDHLREPVASFIEVLHSFLNIGDALEVFVGELIEEVRHDPNGPLPQTPPDTHGFTR